MRVSQVSLNKNMHIHRKETFKKTWGQVPQNLQCAKVKSTALFIQLETLICSETPWRYGRERQMRGRLHRWHTPTKLRNCYSEKWQKRVCIYSSVDENHFTRAVLSLIFLLCCSCRWFERSFQGQAVWFGAILMYRHSTVASTTSTELAPTRLLGE